jgi:predicted site-specific integrase-resolvase
MESNETLKTIDSARRAIISLQQWLADVGVTACTAWRWRKKGWLKTVNICGRQYLTQEAIEEFKSRAAAGEFAQVHKVPARNQERAL